MLETEFLKTVQNQLISFCVLSKTARISSVIMVNVFPRAKFVMELMTVEMAQMNILLVVSSLPSINIYVIQNVKILEVTYSDLMCDMGWFE